MKFVVHGILASLAVMLATPAKARPHVQFDRHAVAGQHFGPYFFIYKRHKPKRHVERKKSHKTLSLARPVVVPQQFKPIDPTDVLLTARRFDPVPDLLAVARRHLGTNPTGWARLWCGRFMVMIAPHAAKRIPNPNLARNWARLPKTEARPGAIAVFTRGYRGGHVGVIKKVLKNGDLIVVSGNHNRRVGEGRYSRTRLIAVVRA